MSDVLATYRLQLHAGFTLADAAAVAPYLARLGISHIHASPIFAARPGSTHGYDVVDPDRINPELGGEDGFRAFADTVRAAGLGIVLDVVPNHMAASQGNRRWEDVLRFGPASPYGRWFDIDWRTAEPDLRNRVLLPVLGDVRARVIARDEIQVAFVDGEPRVRYFENTFPLDPGTVPAVVDRALPALARLLGRDDPRLAALVDVVETLRGLPARTDRGAGALERRRTDGSVAMDRLAALWREDAGIRRELDRAAAEFGAGDDGRRRLRRLLDAQNYRLVFWRQAARQINYRRFFDVNELIALHMENPEVFAEHHRRVLELIDEGVVDGLRIDHPDGLLDPAGYLRRLADEAFDWRPDGRYPIWIEKILSHGELVRPSWPVSGTTGYDFLNQVEALFVDPDGYRVIEADYHRVTRRPLPYEVIARLSKRRVLESTLHAGVRLLARRLLRLRPAGAGPRIALHDAMRAIVDAIAHLPVYRTYVDARNPVPDAEDRRLLEAAVRGARTEGRATAAALDLLACALLPGDAPWRDADAERLRLRFVQRFQQLSGPATAKGLEDTAFYVFVPLLSRNEVGGEPGAPLDDPVAAFHESCRYRAAHLPFSMLSVTTHDTKRSADVRARIDVLSEVPAAWEEALYRFRKMNRPHKRKVAGRAAPDANTEYLLYQSLVGMWPAEWTRPDAPEVPDDACLATLRRRMQEYLRKSAREAKVQTSWVDPDEPWEAAVDAYIEAILSPATAGTFLREFARFVARVARPGLWNSLARTLLQIAAPGIPEIYQGDELWNLALVDPDNRRPVDFGRRMRELDALETGWAGDPVARRRFLAGLVDTPEDGRIKLHVLRAGLAARRAQPGLFRCGTYTPLHADGPAARHVVAFAREHEGRRLVAIAPRLPLRLTGDPARSPTDPALWAGTTVPLPDDAPGGPWRCALSGAERSAGSAGLAVADCFADLPVALLLNP